jgi:hypothetical protein
MEKLIIFWKILYSYDRSKNDPEHLTAEEYVNDFEFKPINEKYCIITFKDKSWILVQDNGLIINTIGGCGL